MLNWTSALILVAPVFLIGYALLHRRTAGEEASFRSIALLYLVCAAAPLAFALLWRVDATRVVIELHGIAFRSDGAKTIVKDVRERRPGSGRVLIGDRSRKQSGAAPARRFGRLEFRPGANGDAKGQLAIELPAPELRAGLVSTRTAGFLGAHELVDGDRVCVGAACWTFDEDELAFTSGKRTIRIPPRVAELPGLDWSFPLPFAKPINAGLRTWSLDWLAHDLGAVDAERRVRSFFCHTRSSDRLQLVTLDGDVSLMRGGVAVVAPTKFSVADGERIAFYTPPPDGDGFAARGVTERRSVVYRAGSRSFGLDLDTPEVHSLRVSELDALRDPKETKKKVVVLSMGDAQLVDRSLYFAGLSDSVAVEATALVELSRFFPRDLASSFRIIAPRGPMKAELGGIQWLGTNDLAAVRLDVRRPPLFLLLAGALLVVMRIFSAAAARLTRTQVLIAGAIEALVGVRLLFGYRAWAMPPHKLEAIELAVVAWLALPWMFLVATVPSLDRLSERDTPWRERAAALAPFAGLLLSVVFTLRFVEGPTRWVWFVCHLFPIAVASWKLARVRAFVADLQARIVASKIVTSIRERLVALKARIAQTRWSHLTLTGDPAMNAVVFGALAFTVVRFLLLLFGFKESANLGGRISLSVLHIPAAAILQGLFFVRAWRRVRENQDLGRAELIAGTSILLFVWVVPALVTSDIGLALLNVPVFALLFLALTRHAAPKRARGRWIARLLVAGVLIGVAGAPLFRLALPLISNEESLLGAASDSNYARFIHFAAPEQLRALATKRGESLAITSAVLQAYISSGLFGRGYGHSEISPHLGDTALRDFAPAVFVAAEWGLVGTMAMLLLYLSFVVLTRDWLPWQTQDVPRSAPVIGFLAAATIAVSSIYMILANHELLLLTGKNAYLLGLDSAGDVIEVIVLVMLIAYGATSTATRRARTFGGSL